VRLKRRLTWDPYLGEVLLILLDVALSVTEDCARDTKAANTQGRGVSLAVVKGITRKWDQVREVKSKKLEWDFPTALFARFMES